jgi:hypothetical protein
MMRDLPIILVLVLLTALFSVPVWARNELFIEDQPNVATPENLEDPEPWKEGKAELPPFPEEENLIEFEVNDPSSSFRYFLDKSALSVGQDGVVRYILVITSKTGARNVFFEGMRCDANEYKTYAFGGGKGKLQPLRKPEWKEMRKNDRTAYRDELKRFYLCHPEYPVALQPEQIIEVIKYGPSRNCVLCD